MDTEEKNIEENLKARFSHIAPSRVSFNKAVEQVTKENDNRSIIVRGEMPSPYQSIYTNFVKKITYIGLPIIALAALIIFINTGVKTTVKEAPLAIQQNGMQADEKTAVAPTQDNVVAPVNNLAIDTTSVDTIISKLISDSDADILLAMNDKDEDSIVNAELDNYNSIKSTTYENAL